MEFGQIRFIVRIIEGNQRKGMLDLLEARRGRLADTLGRAIRSNKLRM